MRCIKAFIAWIKRKKKIPPKKIPPPRQFVFLSGHLAYLRMYNNGKVIFHLPLGKYVHNNNKVQIINVFNEIIKQQFYRYHTYLQSLFISNSYRCVEVNSELIIFNVDVQEAGLQTAFLLYFVMIFSTILPATIHATTFSHVLSQTSFQHQNIRINEIEFQSQAEFCHFLPRRFVRVSDMTTLKVFLPKAATKMTLAKVGFTQIHEANFQIAAKQYNYKYACMIHITPACVPAGEAGVS